MHATRIPRPRRHATLLLAPLLAMALGAGGCDGRQYQPGGGQTGPVGVDPVPDGGDGGGEDGCEGSAPTCSPTSCASDVAASATCRGGSWGCPEGLAIGGHPPGCPDGSTGGCEHGELICTPLEDGDCGAPPPPSAPCVTSCDASTSVGLECRVGEWVCPAGTFDLGTCPPDQSEVCPDTGPPTAQDSTQRVTFRFAAATGYVVAMGQSCGAFQVDRIDGGQTSTLTLGLGDQVVCEGPAPRGPSAALARDLSQGTATLEWDARSLAVFESCVDCATRGWPDAGWQRFQDGAPQPVLPGRYRITFAILDDPATFGCNDGGDGQAYCYPPGPAGPPTGATYASLCPSSRSVTVEIDLPAQGDLEVAVP